MSTKRRLTVSLDIDVFNAVSTQAELRGVSRTRVINELLSASVPSLNKMSNLIATMTSMTEAERLRMYENLASVADEFEEMAVELGAHLRAI